MVPTVTIHHICAFVLLKEVAAHLEKIAAGIIRITRSLFFSRRRERFLCSDETNGPTLNISLNLLCVDTSSTLHLYIYR